MSDVAFQVFSCVSCVHLGRAHNFQPKPRQKADSDKYLVELLAEYVWGGI